MATPNPWWIAEAFGEVWQKRCKQDACGSFWDRLLRQYGEQLPYSPQNDLYEYGYSGGSWNRHTHDKEWVALKDEFKARAKWEKQKQIDDENWAQMDEIRISMEQEKARERERKAQQKKEAEETNRARGLIGIPDSAVVSTEVHNFFKKFTCEVQSVLKAVADYAGLKQLEILLNNGTLSEWVGDALSIDLHRTTLEEQREAAIGVVLDMFSVASPTAGFINALYSIAEMDSAAITYDTASWLASIMATEKILSDQVTELSMLSAAQSAIEVMSTVYGPSRDFYAIVSFRNDGTTSQYKYYIDEEHKVKELEDERYLFTGTIPANYRYYHERNPFPDLSILFMDGHDVHEGAFRFS